MNVLFCSLASHGFIYPAIGIALELKARGHTPIFVTGDGYEGLLREMQIERIPCGDNDRASFQLERWHHSPSIAMQVKHIEYALKRFTPDVLVTQPLSLGAFIVGERTRLPVAVVGLLTHLWPVSEVINPQESKAEALLLWRHNDMLRYYNDARTLFKLPPSAADHRDSPLLGDLFMLQSVPELGVDIDRFPLHVHLVGSCLWEPPADDALRSWVTTAAGTGEPIIYVQHGRSFNFPSFWPHVKEVFGERPFHVAAAIGRFGPDTGPTPSRFFVRDHLCQGAVLPHARVVISGGNTTAVLGALTHGIPSLLLPAASEQTDVAEQIARAGAGISLPVGEATAAAVGQAVQELLDRPDYAARARALKQAFASIQGPERAALLIERLARSRARVTRSSVGAPAGGSCA